jgi:hypothetical protein
MSEMPSQDRTFDPEASRMRPSNRTAPGEHANARTEGLTTDLLGV